MSREAVREKIPFYLFCGKSVTEKDKNGNFSDLCGRMRNGSIRDNNLHWVNKSNLAVTFTDDCGLYNITYTEWLAGNNYKEHIKNIFNDFTEHYRIPMPSMFPFDKNTSLAGTLLAYKKDKSFIAYTEKNNKREIRKVVTIYKNECAVDKVYKI